MQYKNAQVVRSLVSNLTYRKALEIYTQNEIKLIRLSQDHIDAEVFDRVWYSVSLTVNEEENTYSCNCGETSPCQHVAAVMLQTIRFFKEKKSIFIKDQDKEEENHTRDIIPAWKTYFIESILPINIEYISQFTKSWVPFFTISLKDDSIRIYPKLVYIKIDGSIGRWRYNNLLERKSENTISIPALNPALNYFKKHGKFENNYFSFKFKEIPGFIFNLISKVPVYLENNESFKNPVYFSDHLDALIKFQLAKKGRKAVLSAHLFVSDKLIPMDSSFKIVSEAPIYIYKDKVFYRISNIESSAIIEPFLGKEKNTISFNNEDLGEFWRNYFPVFPYKEDIIIEKDLQGETRNSITEWHLYLTEDNKNLYLNLVFEYDDVQVKAESRTTLIVKEKTGTRITINRDSENEQKVIDLLLTNRLIGTKIQGEFTPVRGVNHLDWIFDTLPQLVSQGFKIFGEEKLSNYNINRTNPSISVRIASKINWFDVDINIHYGQRKLETRKFLKAIQDGRKYIPLTNGEIVRIPDKWLKNWKQITDLSSADSSHFKMYTYHLPLINNLSKTVSNFSFDEKFNSIKNKLENFESIPDYPVPSILKGKLRSYQREGYNWLCFLNDLNLGGILADDMGLGKTIQALTFVAYLFQKKPTGPVLIVMPASLIFNWGIEIQKFVPSLTFIEHIGTNRNTNIKDLKKFNIILTTYGIMRKDLNLLQEMTYSAIILDESQNIKNPLSLSFKAANKISAKFKLTLSGTPVENTTIDMWSQMTFVNPGMLGSLSWFRNNFAIPIERENSKEKTALLQKLLRPLVMRRKKEVVEKDLPPKIEQILHCSMTEEQADYYKNITEDYKNRLIREIDQNGLDSSKLRVIEYLTRIRQVCNHPRLIDPSLEIGSGKLNTVLNLINDITSEGYKVLVFSQYVKMLGLIRQELIKEGIPFSYLDGSTRNREQAVDEFQNQNEIKVFLISIKAGGTGLNLTAAEYVIQVDPWWNPAVENQATDRAHRIGQNKKVFVYKLITHGTVEEKILELQNQKKEITNSILTADSGFFKKLSKEDIMGLFSNG